MREIKFRGLRISGEGWVYGSLVVINNLYEICDNSTVSNFREEVIPESVGQLTGLKDRFDNDIYEGDKVKVLYTDWLSNTDDEIPLDQYLDSISSDGVVNFIFDRWVVELKNIYGETYHSSVNVGKYGRLTVISNIHES